MHQIQLQVGLRPRPCWGAYSAPPDPLAGFKEPTSKASRGERREGKDPLYFFLRIYTNGCILHVNTALHTLTQDYITVFACAKKDMFSAMSVRLSVGSIVLNFVMKPTSCRIMDLSCDGQNPLNFGVDDFLMLLKIADWQPFGFINTKHILGDFWFWRGMRCSKGAFYSYRSCVCES